MSEFFFANQILLEDSSSQKYCLEASEWNFPSQSEMYSHKNDKVQVTKQQKHYKQIWSIY